MPEKNIKINDFTVFLWNFGFLLVVLAADIGLIVADIYLESGGLKLILQNLTWPKEIKALFILLGLPPTYLTPPVIFGFVITVAAIASSFLFAHYIIGIIGSLQGVVRRIVRVIAQARQPQEKNQPGQQDDKVKESIAIVDEAYPIFKIILFTLIIGVIMFLYIFPRWTMPIAQLQLASKIWASDFQPQIQGDSITVLQPALPDLNLLMKKHGGEFSSLIVSGFPHALLMLHILIAFLTELFLLHTLNNLGGFEERHSEVIGRIRLRIADSLKRFRLSKDPAYRTQEGTNGTPTMQELDNNDSRMQETSTPKGLNTEAQESPHYADNGNGNRGNTMQNDEPTIDDLKPEDQQIRVVGGSEMISPAEAEKMPELYTVVKNIDPETGDTTYLIYTNEFYQKLQEQQQQEAMV